MTWYEDLSPSDYFAPSPEVNLQAIGWLSPARPYLQAEVSEQIFERLCQRWQNPWQPPQFPVSAGFYLWEFAGRAEGAGEEFTEITESAVNQRRICSSQERAGFKLRLKRSRITLMRMGIVRPKSLAQRC